jgi:hypothetical protein
MYCGSTAYGVGCPYSPHKRHVHADDPKRCIYCGSTSFGVGCPYNPFSKMHIHGVEYNQMMKESIHTSFTLSSVISRLLQPISETTAFHLGIIDELGRKIREPKTIEEANAFTPVDAYFIKLRNLIGEEKLQLLNSAVIIEMLSKQSEEPFDQKLYEKEMNIKIQVANLAKDYKNILCDGIENGISRSVIEKMFIESFLEIDDN